MNIVITMAGAGSRFSEEGFKNKKFKLIAKNRPLFDWAVGSLENFFDHKFYFLAQNEDKTFIQDRCQALGISSVTINTVSEITDGQATSAKIAIKNITDDSGILIHNIDTHINPNVLPESIIKHEYDGYLTLFAVIGDHWSFAQLDDNNRLIDIAEKRRISKWATAGIYYFRNRALFEKVYTLSKKRVLAEMKEYYIAPMYRTMIDLGQYIYGHIIDTDNVIPLGTPDEAKKFDSHFYEVNS